MRPSRRALVGVLLGVVVASLALPNLARADNPQVGGYATVQGTEGSGVRLRSGIWSSVLRNLPEGSTAKIIDEATDRDGGLWYQVETTRGGGWVYGSYLQLASEEEAEQRTATTRGGTRNTAADIGLQYVGYNYRWGGTSPATGFDCSGFVYYVYRTMGVALSRDYWGMMGQGTSVAQAELQPGDLVFFVNTYKAGLSHVGIWVGNGQFVHAIDERQGIQVSSLSNPYYSSRYYGASRIQ